MLTDYHTHLRPDEEPGRAGRFLTEENLLAYLGVARERGIEELGFAEHVYRFREALTIFRHQFWLEEAVGELDAYCEFVVRMKAAGHAVRLGIEMDWIPGRQRQIAALLDGRPWDYVVGSVHFLGDRAFDHPDYDIWEGAEADDVWARYFDALGEAAASGLFDILAHPDLVKVWGRATPTPAGDLGRFYDRAMQGIAAADVAIEVSTAGLRKPAAEIYPAPALLDRCLAAGKPVALSSDAHGPDQVGYRYPDAVAFLRAAGVDEISVFEGRRRRLAPLGAPEPALGGGASPEGR